MDFKILPFELKSANGDGSEFDGIANAFHNIDAAQEIVANGSFTDTIPQFLEVGFVGGLNHNWDSPIGTPVSAVEQPKGLFVQAKLSQTQHGKDCMILLKDRVVKKLSIGYRVLADEMLEDADAVAAYWAKVGYTPSAQDIAASKFGARLLTKLHLYEFSPVTVPANTMADITRVKRYPAADPAAEQQIEVFLRDVAGFNQKACKIVISGIKALYQRDVEEAQTPEPEAEQSAERPPETESAPQPEEEQLQETIEAKTEAEPIIEVPPPVVVDLSAAVRQATVSAHFANFEALKARYGLGEKSSGSNSKRGSAAA